MKCLKWLGAIALFAGCTTAPHSQLVHDVKVQRHTNAFLQEQQVVVWSIRSYEDRDGNRWPIGLTLNARAVQGHDGAQRRFLMLRKDEVSAQTNTAIYEQVRRHRQRLLQQCATTTLVRDGQPLVLPVHSLTVRPLTNSARMPVPPTDTTPDPIEIMVGSNASDQFVISTTLLARLDENAWQKLVSAQTLEYELCGETNAATQAELKGLREVLLH